MEKRLYRVVVEVELVALAENTGEAEDIAMRSALEGGVTAARAFAHAIVAGDRLPKKWDNRCLPYGGDGKTTIGEIRRAAANR